MQNPINDLGLIRVFCAVAEQRSLKKASQILSITPSAVSQSLKTLEERLGLKLLDRTVRPLRMTSAGRRLLIEGKTLLEVADSLQAKVYSESLEKLNLRLGLTESVMETFGPWLLYELSEKVASLSTFSNFTGPTVERLKNDSLDVIISPDGLFHEERWERRLLYEEDFLIVTHRSVEKLVTMDDWIRMAEQLPLICYNFESSDQLLIDRIVRSLPVTPKRFAAVSSSYALVGLVSKKVGWTIMPPSNIWSARHFLKDVNCFEMPKGKSIQREMWVVGDRFSQSAQIELVHETARNVFLKEMIALYRDAPQDLSQFIRILF